MAISFLNKWGCNVTAFTSSDSKADEARKMSAHNVILNYLAETGIIGTLSLITITVINLKTAFNSFKMKLSSEDTQITGAILISILVFSITILYMRAWTWGQDGYIMALLFALIMSWNRKLKQKISANI